MQIMVHSREAGRQPVRRWALRRALTGVRLLLVLTCIFSFPTRVSPDAPNEYQLKAAFLFNFAKFIDWPDQTFSNPQAPFSVCVVGQDPFGRVLDDSLLGKAVGAHSVEIARYPNINTVSASRRCQIVFISASERARFHDVIASFHGANVLLVGDADGFAASGGAIEFVNEDNHIRFVINPDAADRAGLKVSSKLLALAKIIHDDPARGKS